MIHKDDIEPAAETPMDFDGEELTPLEQELEKDILFERNYYTQLALARAVKAFRESYFEEAGFDDDVRIEFKATRMYLSEDGGDVPGITYTYKEEL